MTDFSKLYVVYILKDLFKKINKVQKKIDKNTVNLSEYKLCDGTSKYWRMVHTHDVLSDELETYYKRLKDLDDQTNWCSLIDVQERFNFVNEQPLIMDRFELKYKKGDEL